MKDLHDDRTGTTYRLTDYNELAFVTSQERDSLRWTEITIDKTHQGNYVVHVLGCSDVYHRFVTPCHTQGNVVPGSVVEAEGGKPCPVCEPTLNPDAQYRLEVDQSSVWVCNTHAEVIAALQMESDDGVVFLSRLARNALKKADIHVVVGV